MEHVARGQLLRWAKARGLAECTPHGARLTPEGLSRARRIVRAHRMWELFLISGADIAPDHVDRDADSIEHFLTPEMVARLEAELTAQSKLPAAPDVVPDSPHALASHDAPLAEEAPRMIEAAFAWLHGHYQALHPELRDAILVVGVAALTNVACALLGCYLVLRRMSLLGDAISHAVLPGLVVAFVLSGSMNLVYMFAGALVVGILTTFLTQAVHRQGGVPEDASMGVVFTSLFALGVVLIKRYGQGVDLDPDCVLYGQLDLVEFYIVPIAGYEVPRALVSILPVLLVNIAVITLFWKELKISSFDPALATTMGINAGVLFYLLMGLVAVTTVASFEQVGSILVISMLIVPGATAHLLTDRLSRMMLISALLAVASAVLGYAASLLMNVSAAGPIAVVIGLFYLVAALASPRYGVLSRLIRNAQTSLRIVREDLLAMLYRLEELHVERRLGPREATQAVGAGVMADISLWSLLRRGELRRDGAVLELTDSGRRRAAELVRSHRLWEAYLVEHLGLPADHVHDPAERMEHFIGERMQKQIVADLRDSKQDPHGREIPEA